MLLLHKFYRFVAMHAMQQYRQRNRKKKLIIAGSIFVVLVTAIACKLFL